MANQTSTRRRNEPRSSNRRARTRGRRQPAATRVDRGRVCARPAMAFAYPGYRVPGLEQRRRAFLTGAALVCTRRRSRCCSRSRTSRRRVEDRVIFLRMVEAERQPPPVLRARATGAGTGAAAREVDRGAEATSASATPGAEAARAAPAKPAPPVLATAPALAPPRGRPPDPAAAPTRVARGRRRRALRGPGSGARRSMRYGRRGRPIFRRPVGHAPPAAPLARAPERPRAVAIDRVPVARPEAAPPDRLPPRAPRRPEPLPDRAHARRDRPEPARPPSATSSAGSRSLRCSVRHRLARARAQAANRGRRAKSDSL